MSWKMKRKMKPLLPQYQGLYKKVISINHLSPKKKNCNVEGKVEQIPDFKRYKPNSPFSGNTMGGSFRVDKKALY